MKILDPHYLEKSMSYQEYQDLVESLMQQQKTTGADNSEVMLHYTRMSMVRMERLNRTVVLDKELIKAVGALSFPSIWLIITEAWCGDAAQLLPIIFRLVEKQSNHQMRILLRDENPKLMDHFLTNGSRSIPILLLLNAENLEITYVWGPRPYVAQGMVMKGRKEMEELVDANQREKAYQALQTKLQKWYARDKTSSIQDELKDGVLGLEEV